MKAKAHKQKLWIEMEKEWLSLFLKTATEVPWGLAKAAYERLEWLWVQVFETQLVERQGPEPNNYKEVNPSLQKFYY